jgi:large subunit ribosomal protein L31
MKKNTHPKYQQVLFVDSSTGRKFVCGSTLQPQAKEKFEGVEYPVCYLPISSYSHPFFTGSTQLLDAEGRVEKFKNRYAAQQKKQGNQGNAPKK